jgi:soluble lytic murein transglycosylase-like protein
MKQRTKNIAVPRFVHFSRVVNALVVVLGVSGAIGMPLPGMAATDIYEYTDANGVPTLTNAGAQRPTSVGPGEPDQTARSIRRPARPLTANLQQHVEQAARVHAIDPALLNAIIAVESDNSRVAVSPKGAIGLMQVLPHTGRRFGATDLFNPAQNIEVGARYLRVLAAMFNNDLARVLAAYNAGENAVARFGNRIPPYPETKQYVARVIERYRQLKFIPKTAAEGSAS